MEPVRALEIGTALVHDVDRAGIGDQLVQNPYLAHIRRGDANERWDVAVQVQQGVQLNAALRPTEASPREET